MAIADLVERKHRNKLLLAKNVQPYFGLCIELSRLLEFGHSTGKTQRLPGADYYSINQSINPGFLKWPK